jgi:mono/diheme cytochrome c family protein
MKPTRSFFVALLLWSMPAIAFAESPSAASEGEKLFALRVKPLLEEKCLACHGNEADRLEGGLDLRSRERMLAGGDSFGEEVVVVGDGPHSMLYITTTRDEDGFEMPPKEADQLSHEQQGWLREWIDIGAPWPSDQRVAAIQQRYAEGEHVSTSRALSTAWQNRRYEPSNLWAYRPIQKRVVPGDKHPIDWFLDQRLAKASLDAAPPANARTIARRMTFGLTGLPPTPQQVADFEDAFSHDRTQAVAAFGDELMASPHYGEHFGQHWLDVVRYADTAGFANDYSRPNAWRYRDYVVRAFNDDKPYDEFIRQQIAGDEIDEGDPENLIATGFLRMGPWEQTSMSVFKETRGQWLDDVTDTVGQAFLAHSMLCCKCHDHKFDPVPTRDYYRMMAVFSSTQIAERKAAFLDHENQSGFTASDKWVREKIAGYSKQSNELESKIVQRRKRETGNAKVGDNGLDPGDEASAGRLAKNIARHTIEFDRTQPLALSVYTGATITRANVVGKIPLPTDRWEQGIIEKDVIHTGGDVYAQGDPVQPGALSAAETLGKMPKFEFPGGKGARRLALADWIVHPSNPLTARVIANRIWSWHFGQGIAANPNNFGGTGGLPTHPELLDYLAAWLMRNDWSIKKLNRLILTSQAYQRDSLHPSPQTVAQQDPLGQLYATFQPRRLTAEEIRDAMLFVSGELNPSVGGIPCRPHLNREVAFQPRQIMGGTASVYEPDPHPAQRNRRTLYTEKIRGLRDPFLEVFNQPGPDKPCELRETSIISPQALTLINSGATHSRAIAFAERLMREASSPHSQRKDMSRESDVIDRAFQLAFTRQPSKSEMELCLAHWRAATADEMSLHHEPVEFPAQIVRTVTAEKTGEPYEFVELLPAHQDYQADLQLSDIDAETRGLAHVLRIVLNTNEFIYLD